MKKLIKWTKDADDKLLTMMFTDKNVWEWLIEHSQEKGINPSELRKFCDPKYRLDLYRSICDGSLVFENPHMAKIPKDVLGEYRIVIVGAEKERILCPLINECLFRLFPDMVSKQCKSYQKGIGTGKVVKEVNKVMNTIGDIKGNVIGAKYDFHHYFDTVTREAIFKFFDEVERRLGFEKGTEPVMNLLRRTWSNDWIIDLDKNLIRQWSGIRQGNAVGSWLADVVLKELDDYMVEKYKYYVRYSDDLIVLGENPDEMTEDIQSIVQKYGVSLNLRKTEVLTKDRWFKFLGFNIKGTMITLSAGRVKSFQEEVEKRILKKIYSSKKHESISYKKALHDINTYLYKGNGEYSWATSLLSIVNVEEDLLELDNYVKDALRATMTRRNKIGGLGSVKNLESKTVLRGVGKNVAENRKKTSKNLEGYKSILCMRENLINCRQLFDAIAMQM